MNIARKISAHAARLVLRDAGIPPMRRNAVISAGGGRFVSSTALAEALRGGKSEDEDGLTDEEKRKREKDLRSKKKKADVGRKKTNVKRKGDDDDDHDKKTDGVEDEKVRKVRSEVLRASAEFERRLDRVERGSNRTGQEVDPKLRAAAGVGRTEATGDVLPRAVDDILDPASAAQEDGLISMIDRSMGPDSHAQKALVRCQKKLMRTTGRVA